MKQIVDKLNKIAKKIDESVEIPQTDLIIDSLDAITKAYGGTPNDSNLIVDKLDDIAGVAHSGITPSGNIEITENTAEGEPLDISQYATATVNVAGDSIPKCTVNLINNSVNNIYLSYLLSEYKCIENNYFLANVPFAPANDSENYTLMYVNDEDFYYIAYNSENMTLTNVVNCEVIAEGDWTGYISPIDETLDSSFTLTIDPVPPVG